RVLSAADRAVRGDAGVGDRDDLGVRVAQREPAGRSAVAVRDGAGPARPGMAGAHPPPGGDPAGRGRGAGGGGGAAGGRGGGGAGAGATAVVAGWACLMVFGVGALTRYRVPTIPLGFGTLDLNLPAGKAPFDVVTDFAMFGAVAFETLAVASIFMFRWKYP